MERRSVIWDLNIEALLKNKLELHFIEKFFSQEHQLLKALFDRQVRVFSALTQIGAQLMGQKKHHSARITVGAV